MEKETVYEPPVLVEIGDFADETHGQGLMFTEGEVLFTH
jgi:hypothetical protein